MILLVPTDPLQPRRPDDHFAPEALAAADAGAEVALVDHDALVAGALDGALARFRPERDEPVLYRGWMVPPDRYRDLDRALTGRGRTLVTGADAFARCHRLPGWYPALAGATPWSLWTVGDDPTDLADLLDRFGSGAAVVRDHVKSEKHHWDEAMFIPDVADRRRSLAVATRLRELRGDAFEGGWVLRRFEPFRAGEVRTWWRDGTCVLVTPHPDTPDLLPGPVDPSFLAAAVATLASPFLTVDLARSANDGSWRVVEVGDGQVSDRPRSIGPELFLTAVLAG